MPSIVTERGLGRIVNFSDGTVAIALTLLVLPLVDVAHQITEHGGVWPLFTHNWAGFLAFGISFAVIARFWMVHHQVFEEVVAYNRHLVWINFLWLASIVFLPFSTNVLSYAPAADRGVYALYLATLIVTSGSMLLLEAVLLRTPGLLRPGSEKHLGLTDLAVSTALFGLILVLAVAMPSVGMLWMLLLVLTGPLVRGVKSARRRTV